MHYHPEVLRILARDRAAELHDTDRAQRRRRYTAR